MPSFASSTSSTALAPAASSQSVEALVVSESVNLLDWGDSPADLIGSASSSSSSSSQLHLSFSVSQDMTPQKFQTLWTGLAESFNGKLCTVPLVPSATTDVENKMKSRHILTIASGALPNNCFKFFLYGVEMEDILSNTSGESYLAQLVLLSSGEATAVIKTTSTVLNAADKFASLLISALQV